MGDSIITKVVGGVAAGIGLVSEGISAKKKSSAAKKLRAQNSDSGEGSSSAEGSRDASRNPESRKATEARKDADQAETQGPPPTYEEAMEYDEEQWDLDDAQDDIKVRLSDQPTTPEEENAPGSSASPEQKKQKEIRNVRKLTDAFMAKHPVPEYISEAGKIGLPVVIPQRRPKERHRGFIRAYAPVLATKGIDEATFLEFIETFDKASQASPWIQAINLANFATIPLAPPFSILVSIALQTVVDTTTEMHARKMTNSFIDRANAEFFQPRGLFCLVMTWNADSAQNTDMVDVTSTISNRVNMQSNTSKSKKIRDQFSSSHGNTYGDIEFPEVAPLVFPALDMLADDSGNEAKTKKEKLKKAKNFASEYFDRRAVAKYAGQNPNSVLAAQAGAPTFTSRFADPNHPAASGNLISLVTGGYINPQSHANNVYQDRAMALDNRRNQSYGGRTDTYGRQGFGGRQGGGRDRGFGGLENSGIGMLIGGLVDLSRGRNSNQPQHQQQDQYYQEQFRQQQYSQQHDPQQYNTPYDQQQYDRQYDQHYYDEQYQQQQYNRQHENQPGLPGVSPPPAPYGGQSGMSSAPAPYGRHSGPRQGPGGYSRGMDMSNNPISKLNPILGIKRILKQRVLYMMIVDMPTNEQLSAASRELNRA